MKSALTAAAAAIVLAGCAAHTVWVPGENAASFEQTEYDCIKDTRAMNFPDTVLGAGAMVDFINKCYAVHGWHQEAKS